MNKSVKIAGLAMLSSLSFHASNPKLYLTAGAIGLGAGVGTKSVSKGIAIGATAAWGIIGHTCFDMIPAATKAVLKSEED